MATPNENVDILKRYWIDAIAVKGSWETSQPSMGFNWLERSQWPSRLYGATRAMIELVNESGGDQLTRRAVFAYWSVFELALTLENGGITDAILATGMGRASANQGGADDRPPRQIMLDKIYHYATGGWWAQPDPSGVTEWLKSVHVSAGAMASTILADPKPEVRLAALRLVEETAIPAFWASFLQNQRVFASVQEQLKTSSLGVADRIALNQRVVGAEARVQVEAAMAASATLPTFPTADGPAPTLPAPGKKWYRDARIWSAGALGVFTGVLAGNSR